MVFQILGEKYQTLHEGDAYENEKRLGHAKEHDCRVIRKENARIRFQRVRKPRRKNSAQKQCGKQDENESDETEQARIRSNVRFRSDGKPWEERGKQGERVAQQHESESNGQVEEAEGESS